MKGEFSIRKQLTTRKGEPRGLVSSAKISIELIDNEEGLVINNPFLDKDFAIEFGVKYFHYIYQKENKSGMNVSIVDIGYGHHIDSSPVSIAFVIIKALCNALNFEIDGLDVMEGAIIGFPH
jgi:hypothetical protein